MMSHLSLLWLLGAPSPDSILRHSSRSSHCWAFVHVSLWSPQLGVTSLVTCSLRWAVATWGDSGAMSSFILPVSLACVVFWVIVSYLFSKLLSPCPLSCPSCAAMVVTAQVVAIGLSAGPLSVIFKFISFVFVFSCP